MALRMTGAPENAIVNLQGTQNVLSQKMEAGTDYKKLV